jgi:hypothetical protein
MQHRTTADLDAALDELRGSPADAGTLALIVVRPAPGERVVLDEARLDRDVGLDGDSWLARGSRDTGDGSSEHGRQLTLMNSRAVDLFSFGDATRWRLAGDQLYVDISLASATLPPGTQLAVGDGGAVVEVSPLPHTGCVKFVERFGRDVARFVNSEVGRALNLRGVNAFVVAPGTIRRGDALHVA